MSLDFKAISAAALPHLLDLAREVDSNAKREGGEITLLNPRRADANLGSFRINAETGVWSDFATGEKGGDVVSWWAYCKGLTQSQAARELAERFAPHLLPASELSAVNRPAPADAPEPDFHRYAPAGTTFNAAWCYRDAHGDRLGYAIRFEDAEGKKDPRPLRWNGSAWECKAFHEPRPLYGLDELAKRPGATVLVCEGEKAADAARVHFPECIAVTSPGGSKASAKADWGPLHDRQVILWPDHDAQGAKYAEEVAKLTRRAGAASVRRVKVPDAFPEKWDLADPIPEGADLRALLEGAEESEPSAWEHPTLPIAARDPWIVGDIRRWMTEAPPRVKWLVEGLIPARVPGLLAARANGGKSMTALSLSMGVASGRGALGLPVSEDAARGVVYVSLEDDEPEAQRRIHRGLELLKEDGCWTSRDDEVFLSRFQALFPDRTSGARFALQFQWQAIAAKANAIPGGCGFIILDTLARLSEGDENSASETRAFVEAQAALVQATGATVLAIHHVGKGNDTLSGKKLHERLHPEALRGSSAIEAGARFILTMAALSPQEAATAGLDESEALNGGLVALKLAKASQSEKGRTVLLERRHADQPGAGFLMLHPESERALAAIQGEAAVLRLNKRDAVLLAIAEAGHLGALDQKSAAARLWPDARDSYGQWRKALSEMRKAGLVDDLHLTELGLARAATLGFHRQLVPVEQTGTGQAEQPEQNPQAACSVVPSPKGVEQRNRAAASEDEWGAA